MRDEKPHVVVLGMMGVGKSTTGEALAESLGWRFGDSDDDIELLVGCSGAEFAADTSVAELHQLEAAVLLGALARTESSVIAAAASTIEDPLVRRIAPARATVVRLRAPLDVVLERQASGSHRRPMDADELATLADRREPLFVAIEDLRLDATDDIAAQVEAVRRHLGRAEPTRRSASSGPDRNRRLHQ